MGRKETIQRLLTIAMLWAIAVVAQAQAPNISSFQPWHAAVGDEFAIEGQNLSTATALYINNKLCDSLVVENNGHMKAVVPTGAVTGRLKVVTSFGEYTTGSDFIVDGTGGGGGGTSGGGGGTTGGGYVEAVPPNIAVPDGAMVGHPRIFVRKADVQRLRNWAVPTNEVWVGLDKLAKTAKQRMDNNTINDIGQPGWNVNAGYESYAEIMAFMSMVHPDLAARKDYANRAYTLIMKVFNEAAKGQDDTQPFRHHIFATENRASWYGEGFALTVDWIYHKFTAADKAKIRKVFLRWIQENCHANTTAYEHPRPLNTYNSPLLVDAPDKVRWATNNYYSNHARQIALMSMAMDEVDDIPTGDDVAPAGTLRKFIGNTIQAWLYQQHHFETTIGAGGISPEGLGYGELSMRPTSWILLAMNTTHVDKPGVYGPQAAMIGSPYWKDQVWQGFLHMQSPSQQVQESWIGPAYLPYLFSDTGLYKNVDYVRVFGPLAVYAYNKGDMAKYARLRWMIDNMVPGGTTGREWRIASAFEGSSVSLGIFYYLACDPNFNVQVDPRPELPTEYIAKGLGIFSSRTGWDTGASWFVWKSTWNSIDHQFGDANSVALWRDGEWLTKPKLGYGSTIACSDYQNTVAIQNPGNTIINFWQDNLDRGSQFVYNQQGNPKGQIQSYGDDYAFVQAEITDLYNNPMAAANAVTHSSRGTVFLKPDAMVIYDRATTSSPVGFKRFWLNTPELASISGKAGAVTTSKGQKMFIDTLLPANAVVTSSQAETLGGQPAPYDPMQYRYMAEDLSNPADVRFMHVVQGADALAPKLPVTKFQSTAGTKYDGAIVGTKAVLFKRAYNNSFSGVSFTVPSTVTKVYLTGVKLGLGYTVTKTPNGANVQITVSVGGALAPDAAGVLAF